MSEEKIRIPPHSKEAEEAVLGCLLLDEAMIDRALEYIPTEEVFFSEANKILFKHILEMKRARQPVDIVTLIGKLSENDKIYCSPYYITGLSESAPISERAGDYAKIVLEKYLQRKLVHNSHAIQNMAYDNTVEFERLIEKIHKTTEEIENLKPIRQFNLEYELDEAIIDIKTPDNVVNFGFPKLDNLAGGMTKGEVSIIAGRPGHGKTTFALNLLRNLLHDGQKVLVINREMTNKEMFKKLLVLESGNLSYKDIRLAKLTLDEHAELETTKEKLMKYNDKLIMYDDITDLDATITAVRKVKPDVVIDDYIQLAKVPGMKDRRFEIESLMQEYKWTAKILQIPIILLSQLNREIEKREDPIPKTSDLAESGSIEQVAENILFVYYDWKVKYEMSTLGKSQIQVVAGKVRYGETGIATFGFDGDKCLFANSKEDVKFSNKGGTPW